MDISTTDNNAPLPTPIIGALLDCTQAAHYLSVSESYVRKCVASNKIAYVKIGSRTLFRRSDLDQWIEEHVVPTSSEIRDRAEKLAATTMLWKGAR